MDFSTLAVMFVAIGLGAVSKGATGMGMPLIAIPIIATFTSVQQAIGVLIVPLIVSNAYQVWRFRAARHDGRLAFLGPMLIACGLGILLGTWGLTAIPERGLEFAMGLILAAYLALRLLKPESVLSEKAARSWSLPVGLGGGILQGATGIASPIVVPFVHAMRFARETHVFAVSALFFLLAMVQAPALYVAGILRPDWLMLSVLALIPTFAFMPVGQVLAAKLSQRAFDRAILVLLAVMGLKMLLGL